MNFGSFYDVFMMPNRRARTQCRTITVGVVDIIADNKLFFLPIPNFDLIQIKLGQQTFFFVNPKF